MEKELLFLEMKTIEKELDYMRSKALTLIARYDELDRQLRDMK